jgi:hypothetical protein
MSLSNAAESDLLKLLFQNVTWAGLGDVTGVVGSGAAGSLYVALHTADPGEAGNQSTSEANYTGYARVAVARSAGGWTVSGTAPTQVANAGDITFGACTAGSNTITHFSIGLASSGANEILASGAVSSPLPVGAGITPAFAIGQLTTTVD